MYQEGITTSATPTGFQLTEAVFTSVFDVTLEPPVVRRRGRGSIDQLQSTSQRRRARTSNGLTRLYAEREDLRGISGVADLVVEAVRWSV